MQPGSTDVQGWRDWIANTLNKGPLAEYRAKCDLKRRHPVVKVNATDFSVKCTGDVQESFNVHVWVPERAEKESKGLSRPAILFFHGGGWIHGNSLGDEGEILFPVLPGGFKLTGAQFYQSSSRRN